MARVSVEWPNVEKFARAWVETRAGHNTWTETPANLATNLPAYRLERIGGSQGADGITKTFQVEVTTYAADRDGLWQAVAGVETAMYDLASNGTEDWYADEVTETFAAAIEPNENGDVRKATAVYGIAVRPRTTTP